MLSWLPASYPRSFLACILCTALRTFSMVCLLLVSELDQTSMPTRGLEVAKQESTSTERQLHVFAVIPRLTPTNSPSRTRVLLACIFSTQSQHQANPMPRSAGAKATVGHKTAQLRNGQPTQQDYWQFIGLRCPSVHKNELCLGATHKRLVKLLVCVYCKLLNIAARMSRQAAGQLGSNSLGTNHVRHYQSLLCLFR